MAQALMNQDTRDEVLTAVAPGTMAARNAARAVSTYQMGQIVNMTPVEVIKRLYEVAIVACRKQDIVLGRKAINELIRGLNFEYAEIATGLFRLYDYAKRMMRKGDYDEAARVLTELRSAWVEAFKLE